MGDIIKRDRSVIPACDVRYLEELKRLVDSTCEVEGIGGYKVGFSLVLRYGLPTVCETIKKITDLPIIYDHQKGGTDIPETGGLFAKVCKESGADAVILFPFTGPMTEMAWIEACKRAGLGVIVGGDMTHSMFNKLDGGWMDDNSVVAIYDNAKKYGVRDFVIPGNKPDRIKVYRKFLEAVDPVFYSPGLVTQGGKISDAAKAAGGKWHAIIGRAIYKADDMGEAAKMMTKELLK